MIQSIPTQELKEKMLENPRNMINVQDPKQNYQSFSVGVCMGCHGVAQVKLGPDFSFLPKGSGGRGFDVDTIGLKDAEEMAARLLKYSALGD